MHGNMIWNLFVNQTNYIFFRLWFLFNLQSKQQLAASHFAAGVIIILLDTTLYLSICIPVMIVLHQQHFVSKYNKRLQVAHTHAQKVTSCIK